MYDSDLSEEEWQLIKHHFEPEDNRGVKPKHAKRDIINAIVYINKKGAQWRSLPKDFPPWTTVYDHYSRWNRRGVWEAVLDELSALHRKKDKNPKPSYGIVDSQSVKTVSASEQRGIDGVKKVKGRKRHIVVDTLGNLIHVIVHTANTHDTKAGCEMLKATAQKYQTLETFSGDAGYRSTTVDFVEQVLNLKLHISEKIKDSFAVLPMRWVVERPFAWLDNYRRLSKDYETLAMTAENMVRIACGAKNGTCTFKPLRDSKN